MSTPNEISRQDEAAAKLDRYRVSIVTIGNGIAAFYLGAVFLLLRALGPYAMVGLPLYILFILLGWPWSASLPHDGLLANQGYWSRNNLFYEILTFRGTFLNFTCIGLLIDVIILSRLLICGQDALLVIYGRAGLTVLRRGRTLQLCVTSVVVLVVFGMFLLPHTDYGRQTMLDRGWQYVRDTSFVPGVGAPVAKGQITGRGIDPIGRRDIQAAERSIEEALNVNLSDRAAVAQAEHTLSAAILCMMSSPHRRYQDLTISEVLEATIDTKEKVDTFRAFVREVDYAHALPVGDGCIGDGVGSI